MTDITLGAAERRFADILWAHAPMSSTELWKLCEKELEWKKTTTFTVLKRLTDKGLFQNEGGTVTVRITREEYDAARSRHFVAESFQGSLPAFLAAFTSGKPLSDKEVAALRAFVAQYGEGSQHD